MVNMAQMQVIAKGMIFNQIDSKAMVQSETQIVGSLHSEKWTGRYSVDVEKTSHEKQ